MIAWFGIRGIGSVYYLMYAISHGLAKPLAEQIIAITLAAITVSIVLHGTSITKDDNRTRDLTVAAVHRGGRILDIQLCLVASQQHTTFGQSDDLIVVHGTPRRIRSSDPRGPVDDSEYLGKRPPNRFLT